MHKLLSWDIVSMYLLDIKQAVQKNVDLEMLHKLQRKFRWQVDFGGLLDKEDYTALVVTDRHQKIIWVNEGFKHMTGFPFKNAIGNTPVFLQGPGTCPEVKKRIREGLRNRTRVSETIVNYKKNKAQYHCKVTIYVLVNDLTDEIHFIAFEKELKGNDLHVQ